MTTVSFEITEPFVAAMDLALDRLQTNAPVGTPRLSYDAFCAKCIERILTPFRQELVRAQSQAIYGKLAAATDEQLVALGLTRDELN